MEKSYIIGQVSIANDPTAVKFTAQSLTSEQQVQAQTNIGLNGIQLVETNTLEYTLYVGGQSAGVINIPQDQFLESVAFDPETGILTFVFNTSGGQTTTNIDISSLIDTYTAGNGLQVSNNQFSVKLDGSQDNSLTISANGLMLDKTQFASTAEFQNLSAQVTDNTAQIETLNSNYVKSPVETSAFINGRNTLANAQSSFTVESSTLADGTAVTVRKANKNLAYFDNQTYVYLSVSDNIFTANGTSTLNAVVPSQYVYITAGTYTLGYKYISGTVEAVEGTSGDIGYIRIYNKDGTALTQNVIVMNQNNYKTEMSKTITITENCFARLYPLVATDKIYTKYKFVCSLEKSDTYTGYEKPVYEDITTAVGQSINITQYDNITNLSVLTEGAVVSGQFILSTQYELNDKLTPLFGKFASRPTTSQPYAILYIATDQTGENKVTILPANTDGSVSGNWISI